MSKSDINELLGKGFIALIIRIIGFISGYLFIYYTVKYFGAAVQGRLSLCFSFMIIGSLISRIGIDINLVRVFAISNNFLNSKGIYFKVIPWILSISISISLIVFFMAEYISITFFNDPLLTPFLKYTAPCIMFFTIVLVNAGVLRGLRLNSIYAFLFNGGRFLFTFIFFWIFFLVDGRDNIIAIKSHTSAIFILFLISILSVKKQLITYNANTDYRLMAFIKESFPMFFSASLIVLLGWTDTIILGIYRESESVGMYHVILKIATVISFTLQAVDSILAPKLSKAYHSNDMSLFKMLVKYATLINAVISVLAFIFIFIFRNFILEIFGEEFLIVSFPLIILCVGQLFNAVFGPIGSIFQMTGHQKIFQNILIISFIINLILNVILAPKYGIYGVSVATAFSLVVSKILGAIYVKIKVWNVTSIQKH